MDHDWLQRMLEQRVDDKAFIGLIRKWLKAGIQEETGDSHPSGNGNAAGRGDLTGPLQYLPALRHGPVGGEESFPSKLRGTKVYMRYADDFIVGFQYERRRQVVLSGTTQAPCQSSDSQWRRRRVASARFSRTGDMKGSDMRLPSSGSSSIGHEPDVAIETVKRRTSKIQVQGIAGKSLERVDEGPIGVSPLRKTLLRRCGGKLRGHYKPLWCDW